MAVFDGDGIKDDELPVGEDAVPVVGVADGAPVETAVSTAVVIGEDPGPPAIVEVTHWLCPQFSPSWKRASAVPGVSKLLWLQSESLQRTNC